MNRTILQNLVGAKLIVSRKSDGEIIVCHPIKKAKFSCNILQLFTDSKVCSEWAIAGGQLTINSTTGKITKIDQSSPFNEQIVY